LGAEVQFLAATNWLTFPDASLWRAYFGKPESWINLAQVLAVLISVFNIAILISFRKDQTKIDNARKDMDNFIALNNYLQSEYIYKARQHMYMALSNKAYVEWTDDDKRMAGIVCSSYDLAGLFAKNALVNERAFFDFWAKPAREAGAILDSYMKERDYHWLYFAWLAKKAAGHQDPRLV
jgi:hypothetical protein